MREKGWVGKGEEDKNEWKGERGLGGASDGTGWRRILIEKVRCVNGKRLDEN